MVCINKQSSETGNVRLGEKERGGERKRESGARYPYSIEATIFTRFFLIKLPAAAALLSAAIIRHGTGYEQYSPHSCSRLMDATRAHGVIPAALNEPCNRAHETRSRNPARTLALRAFSATKAKKA